ncbi:MAG: threonine ammonia-lyase [Hydrocarboniphaga sp.]|uniref:threonine ammonia-lyase n=1 Tax=Hydrocarboniphaga sp. TaxID=2033016 RepID=UPI0026375420|nr:threonine ammonia-lyase [Hydrocarboniphaga sp.]MDB5968133.1 threonine ammonia-lyase [Hydrocarboniphaga sp.]
MSDSPKSSVVSYADVVRAAEVLSGQVINTPCRHSRVLSRITGADVWLKFENFQFTASFKERGALNKLAGLTEAERAAGVAAMSAGNHAQGVAYHATRLGIKSVIVMPVNTPFTKVKNTRELGGEVILHGENLAESQAFLEAELIRGRGMTLVHPYDDAKVIAGQGTIALEMLAAVPELDTLVIPIGGGGLISGMAIAAHGIKPDLRVVGVESAGYPSAYAALQGDPNLVKGGQTIAEGIAVRNIGKLTIAIIREHVAELMRVDEASIERAVGLLATIEKVIAEGAGATGLAALLSDPARFAGRKVGLVICGGNIDSRLLASVLLRQLVHESRLVSLTIDIEDRPGFLARVAGRVGDSGGNIIQVHHERLHASTHAKNASLELLIEAQDELHADQIIADLQGAGFVVRRGVGGMEFD